jgi:hypothetical protein
MNKCGFCGAQSEVSVLEQWYTAYKATLKGGESITSIYA